MNECPWCGHKNLNVYSYCQSCGRGLAGPETKVKVAGKPRKLPFPLSLFVSLFG